MIRNWREESALQHSAYTLNAGTSDRNNMAENRWELDGEK
jgi:hypothetical protein